MNCSDDDDLLIDHLHYFFVNYHFTSSNYECKINCFVIYIYCYFVNRKQNYFIDFDKVTNSY